MSNAPLKPPGNNSSRSNAGAGNNNFAKALLEAGGHTVQTTVDSGVQFAGDALSSLFGAGSGTANTQQNQDNNSENGAQSLESQTALDPEQQEQEWKQREMRMLRHREVQQTEVFDGRKVETDRKIAQILEQLEALTKELDETNRNAREAQIAVMQGAVHGGDYHVTFFEQLIKVIVMLRKHVREANSWIEAFNSKKSAKKGYWGQFYQNGMQWAMSGERSIATSVG